VKGVILMTDVKKFPIRVLLADDHALVRAGICQFLGYAEDIRVIAEADDGEKAIQLLAEYKPDVAVLDIQMPVATGIDVTRWVRANHLPIGVLVLSAYNDDPYVLAVLEAGANGYVLKTSCPADLIQAIRDVYAGKSALDASITAKLIAQVYHQQGTRPLEPLSDREMEVLLMAAEGDTNKAIGLRLGISDRTVQGHLARIYFKLQVTNRTEAVMRAVSMGWVNKIM
jgi:DNA-binding NarL/FixJ family response regulator